MKKFFAFIAVLLFLSGMAAAAWYGWTLYTAQGEQKTEQTARVTLGDIESLVTAQGTLEPLNYVDVGAQVSGLIEKMYVEIGASVKTGDPIAEIDPDVYQSRVQADQARLKTLEAQKAEQEALMRQAQQKYDRNQNLYKNKAVSEEVLQDAETTLAVAQANVMALEAQIEEAQSTLEGDKSNLGYTKIFAPMDGTIVSQSVQEGQTINANQTAPVIVQVANLDIMTVKAQVAEADVMKLKEGMSVYFTTLGAGTRRWEGKVRQILPSPETINDVVLYNVLVDVENKDHSLMTGMTAQMFFVLAQAENVPLIPLSALGKRLEDKDTDAGQAYEVRLPGGRKKTVIVSISDRLQAAVTEGLKKGDVVLTSPAPAETAKSPRMRMPRL
jgi:macrolide-specific efflux system membrane fusion protein